MSQPPPPPSPGTRSDPNVRTWTVACHVAAAAVFVFPAFGNILGPLIVWLFKRHDDPLIDYHGKESINFQLSMTIYGLAISLLALTIILIPLVWLALAVLGIVNIVLVIIAAIKASNNDPWRYPLTIRLVQ